jgi:hypothetical protein
MGTIVDGMLDKGRFREYGLGLQNPDREPVVILGW